MALRAVYERFLAAPTLEALSPDASWNYITTTTTVTGAEQITKHLNTQQRIVKKKGDKTLSAVETPNAIVLDVETTLEFLTGGGAYLPSLDDNFLADRVVTFPTVHIVRFNSQNQIQQVRIYWDQGSLLKQVEVIGSRGRNWPIRDANEQSKLISNVVAAQGTVTPPPQETVPSSATTTATRKIARPPSRDPSELFFGGGEQENEPTPRARDSIISPRAGANKHFRPVRVFGDDDGDDPVQASPIKPKIGSHKGFQPVRVFDQDDEHVSAEGPTPSASSIVPQPRAGSTKNFHAIRVFEQGDDSEVAEEKERAYKINPNRFSHFELVSEGHDAAEEKERAYKTNPTKFSHFELGEAAEPSREIQGGRSAAKSRPLSQWNFEDFNTPEKPRRKFRAEDIRHFGWSDNEDDSSETPPARPRVAQPRRDAQTHLLNMGDVDDSESAAPRRTVGTLHNNGLGLYENNLYDEEANATPHEAEKNKNGGPNHQPLGIVPNNAHRKKDFDAHWEVHDPTPEETKQKAGNPENIRPVSADRVKAVQMMNSSWDMQDPTTPEPKPVATTTTTSLPKRASRAMFQPSWSLGDVDE